MSRRNFIRIALVAVLAALVVGLMPVSALAETSTELQAQLDDAQSKLNDLSTKVAALGEQLNDMQYQIDQTQSQLDDIDGQITSNEAEIAKKEEELASAQDVLSKRVSSTYKAGSGDLLSILLDSDSLDELISNAYYANKVSQQDEEDIAEVKQIKEDLAQKKADLEDQRSQQQTLLDQQTQQQADFQTQQSDYEAQQAEQQTYVDSLDQQVKDKIAEEEAAQIAAQQAAAASAGYSSGSGNTTYNFSGSDRDIIVQAAYSQLGVPYSWGGYSPGSGLDCSGLTKWCYAQAGYNIPHSAAGQSSSMTHISADQLQPGDLIFFIGSVGGSGSGSHVALYVGDGYVIHAAPWGVVKMDLASVYSGWSQPTGYGTM